MSRPAVFLDRDGTLIHERGFLDRMEMLELFPWTTDALRLLRRAGYATVVITNQSGVGRGILDEPFLHAVHRELDVRLAAGGAAIDGYYFCPHHVDATIERYRMVCRCRKPGPELIERACRDLDLDASRSFMIGDRWSDVGCGHAAGAGGILLRSGAPLAEPLPGDVRPDAILDNLMEAVGWILHSSARSSAR